MLETDIAIKVRELDKVYGAAKALSNVSLEFLAGRITALLGENGAGKSTLLKILAGLQAPSSGTVSVFGERVVNFDPNTLLTTHSVAIVPQELQLLQDRTVAENILAGAEPGNRWFPSQRNMRQHSVTLMTQLGLALSPDEYVRDLSMATQQMVLVARSVARGCKVLIFDEPTAMLTPAEVGHLFAFIERLKSAGTTVIYVSHRMPEIFRICDQIEVLRDGQHVASWQRTDTTPQEVVAAMVGRELSQFEAKSTGGRDSGAESIEPLRVAGLSGPRHRNVSFAVQPGEVLGFAGLPDSGRVELLHNIFGYRPGTSGVVEVLGVPYRHRTPSASIKHRLAFVPGERRSQGLLPNMSVADNVGILAIRDFVRMGLIRYRRFLNSAAEQIGRLRIVNAALKQPITALSGGNQQKAMFGRWLTIRPAVLMLDEPTRGVDVGAKAEIYGALFSLLDEGVAVLCSSSDLPELLAITDRIGVMREGELIAIVQSSSATEESVMALATGVLQDQETERGGENEKD